MSTINLWQTNQQAQLHLDKFKYIISFVLFNKTNTNTTNDTC